MKRSFFSFILSIISIILLSITLNNLSPSTAFAKLSAAPDKEQWFGIYVDNERVGFYRQKLSAASDGYTIEASGSVKMKIMGFSKEASMRESYTVTKSLGLKTFDVNQTISGSTSRVSGKVSEGAVHAIIEEKGVKKDKTIKIKGEIFPGAVLNILPLMRETKVGKSYKINFFDPEESKVKEVKISVIGIGKSPDGKGEAVQLRNNLYPFVTNDIWVNSEGETILESVRDGLVMTKKERAEDIASFIGNLAIAKKDLIYDFSMIKIDPPLTEIAKKERLKIEITGFSDAISLQQSAFQKMTKKDDKVIVERSIIPFDKEQTLSEKDLGNYLSSVDKIEAASPEIVEKSKEITKDITAQKDKVSALAKWSGDYLTDSVDDGGGAVESLKSKHGNCQTHARLYTALARAASIPTRFVSGIVYQEKLGFLYHSWSESFIDGLWRPVDPTFNQSPADVSHIKLFEGERPEDLTPIIAIIGKIKIKVIDPS